MLFLIGLGLGDEKDITIKGLEAVRHCSKVFLESYTSILGIDKAKLEEFYGKEIIVADRNCVESEAEMIYGCAKMEDVALLVVGDPFCATTHSDIWLRAKQEGIEVKVIHNASVMGAIGSCGLQLYNFGHTISIPFFEGEWKPTSFYEKVKYNKSGGMHTLCLLDIKVKEPDFEEMAKGRIRYLPPRYMTINRAIEQLIETEEIKGEGVITPEMLCVGLARLGNDTQQIVAGTLNELRDVDFGPPLHCFIICGQVHPMEEEVLSIFRLNNLPNVSRITRDEA